MKSFHDTCKGLHIDVMRAIGLGLGLKEGFFDEYTDKGDNTLRLLHYPSTPKEVFVKNKDTVRAGRHTDYGSITLLFQVCPPCLMTLPFRAHLSNERRTIVGDFKFVARRGRSSMLRLSLEQVSFELTSLIHS